MRLNDVLFQSLAYRGVCNAYERRTDDVPCDTVSFLLRTFGLACLNTTSIRRSQEKSHPGPIFIQSYGRGRTRIENSYRGLLWSFLKSERQRRHVAKLRPGRNIIQGPIVRRERQHQRWLVITIALWKRIATGRQRLLQKFLADGARNV